MADNHREASIEAGMLNGLLGWSILREPTHRHAYLMRNSGFIYNVEQMRQEGWNALTWIDCDPFDDGSDRFLLAYHMHSETRAIKELEFQVLIHGPSPWHSLAAMFDTAAELEQRLIDRFNFRLTTDVAAVESGRNQDIGGSR